MQRSQRTNLAPTLALLVAGLLALPGCSIHVRKDNNGEDKKVDIETPVGGIHVSKGADARDTGLPIYPGARQKEEDKSGDEKSANVNISAGSFALKVVAVEFLSDDSPDKVTAYYKDQLKKYGAILECHTTNRHGDSGDVDFQLGKDDDKEKDDQKDSHQLKCEQKSGPTIELKVGTKENQRLVAISPQDKGKGTDFALVYVQTRGTKKDMI
jgi:hypothetical protein